MHICNLSKRMVLFKFINYYCIYTNICNTGELVDFVFVVGDDRTDEDMFQVIKNVKAETSRSRSWYVSMYVCMDGWMDGWINLAVPCPA